MRNKSRNTGKLLIIVPVMLILLTAAPAFTAEEVSSDPIAALEKKMQDNINIVWTCVAAFLVFFMQAGFAMVEAAVAVVAVVLAWDDPNGDEKGDANSSCP